MARSGSILGTRVHRVEDPALLRGGGTYIDNVAPRDALHVAFVRAMTAHGRILSIMAVVAETAREAADATKLVWADVDPLPALIDPEEAARDTLVLIPDVGTNVMLDQGEEHQPRDLEGEVVVHQRMVNQRMAPVPLEGRVAADLLGRAWQAIRAAT